MKPPTPEQRGTETHQKLAELKRQQEELEREADELLITKGAEVNAKDTAGTTPLDWASGKMADLLRKHGGKTSEELKAEGK